MKIDKKILKEEKCPYCGEKVFKVIHKGIKKYCEIRMREEPEMPAHVPRLRWSDFFIEHNCFVPHNISKRLRK